MDHRTMLSATVENRSVNTDFVGGEHLAPESVGRGVSASSEYLADWRPAVFVTQRRGYATARNIEITSVANAKRQAGGTEHDKRAR